MSATNGGRGTPPVPPPGHGLPAQTQEIPIEKEVTLISKGTLAQRTEDGAILSFIVIEGGLPVKYSYVVGAPGKKLILEELSGGLTLP
jgi:hypothetical protein